MDLEVRNISKSFPGVKALDGVSAVFHSGEIHALLGENGAGKSTAVKIMSGIYTPDQGQIFLDGEELHLKSSHDAMEKGISIVHQEIQVVPLFSVAENILLDKLDKYRVCGKLDWKRMKADSEKYLDQVGLHLDVTQSVENLSVAQKQMIQIAKAISTNAKVLFLDEPTASLTGHEVENLFNIVKKMKEEGKIVIFITHKLEEVLEICDRITVLRDGKMVGTRECKGLSKSEIIKLMIGREVRSIYLGNLDIKEDEVVLEARNITQNNRFNHLNFQLHRGEILGFYGLVGAGRTELAKILIGEDKDYSGEIYINGKLAKITSVADSVYKYGLGYVSENRKEEGLILQDSIKQNMGIVSWPDISFSPLKIISPSKEKELVRKMISTFSVKMVDENQMIENLSGGNQQKVSIGKWIAKGCDIIIIDEPSVGVDIGVKEVIHRQIWDLAKKEGKSIILISSDMPEMCTLARRILVFKNFQISGEISGINDREYSYNELSSRIGQYLI